MLEPCEVKVSRTVLRGARSRKAPALPGARKETIMIKGLAHVCLSATDLAAAERFYCFGLGFRKRFDFIHSDLVIGFYLEVPNLAPNFRYSSTIQGSGFGQSNLFASP
jgi:hypothetical protein